MDPAALRPVSSAPPFPAPASHHIKREPLSPPLGETDSSMASTTSSPASDTDKLSFPAATAIMLAPQLMEDDLFFDFDMGEDASSEDFETNVKMENNNASARGSTSTSGSGSGRRAMTPEERRQRRNEKERQRVQSVKARIEELRKAMTDLQKKHAEMQMELEQRVRLQPDNSDDIKALMATYLTQSDTTIDERDEELRRRYLVLVRETEQLQLRKRSFEDQLRPRIQETSMLKELISGEGPQQINHSAISSENLPLPSSISSDSAVVEKPRPILMDAVSVLEALLMDDPLTTEEATGFVEATCREMMQALARTDWIEGFDGFGWRGSRRLDPDGSVLQFRLSQTFKSVSVNQLVQKTWRMLTNLEEYRRIQPQMQHLRVLQKVNDECWVMGGAISGARLRCGLVLVARAIIHGGYLVTFRTLPLVRKGKGGDEYGRRKFVERETGGMYINMFSWYNFQERPNASGGVDCEVIFGGTGRNGDAHYLKQLQLEVVAGITRWQSAVGFTNFVFSPMVTAGDSGQNQEQPQQAQGTG